MWKTATPQPVYFEKAPPHPVPPLGGAARGRCAPRGRRSVCLPPLSPFLLRPRGGVGAKIKLSLARRAPPLASFAGPATGRRAARAMVRNETTLPVGSLSSPVSEPQGPRRWWAPGTGARSLASHGRAARWTSWPPRTFRTRRGGLERAPVTCGRGRAGRLKRRVATLALPPLWAVGGGGGAPALPAVVHPAAVARRG